MLVIERPYLGLCPHEGAVPDADVVDMQMSSMKRWLLKKMTLPF
jgi:hypothetical protein